MQCSQKIEEELKQSQNSTQKVPDLNKSLNNKSFLRHNSMPGAPSINKKVDRELVSKPVTSQNKYFSRTISMPTRRGQSRLSPSSISSTSCKYFLFF